MEPRIVLAKLALVAALERAMRRPHDRRDLFRIEDTPAIHADRREVRLGQRAAFGLEVEVCREAEPLGVEASDDQGTRGSEQPGASFGGQGDPGDLPAEHVRDGRQRQRREVGRLDADGRDGRLMVAVAVVAPVAPVRGRVKRVEMDPVREDLHHALSEIDRGAIRVVPDDEVRPVNSNRVVARLHLVGRAAEHLAGDVTRAEAQRDPIFAAPLDREGGFFTEREPGAVRQAHMEGPVALHFERVSFADCVAEGELVGLRRGPSGFAGDRHHDARE